MSTLIDKARTLRATIEALTVNLDDNQALDNVELFPKWKESVGYLIDDRVRYDGMLYKCLASHTSQSTWTPFTSPSLWVRIDNPTEEWPEWIQPLGSTDAYPEGAKVSHNEKHWISNINNNVWEPGIYGWNQV